MKQIDDAPVVCRFVEPDGFRLYVSNVCPRADSLGFAFSRFAHAVQGIHVVMVSMHSWGLVGGQVVLLGYLALSGSWLAWQGSAVFLVAGALLGLWALVSMRLRHLRIVPEVHPEGRLVVHGPYRWIRHPMYTSVLLFSAGMVGADPQLFRVAAGLGLVAVLVLKLLHEEKLLHLAFPDYATYCATTQRLIPWVW